MEETAEVPQAEPETCVHRWVLGSPVAGITSGLCKECGKERDFTDARPAQPYGGRGRRK